MQVPLAGGPARASAATGIEVVAFDGDDTLWHSESHFVDAHARFCALVAPYVDRSRRASTSGWSPPSGANLALYGYGAKAFTLSLIETAIDLTDGRVTSRRDQRHPRPGQAAAATTRSSCSTGSTRWSTAVAADR